jgi:methenyltetrahydrofolate cyclohydrolase
VGRVPGGPCYGGRDGEAEDDVETLEEWLEGLASGAPTPGGGAASAVTAGIGAALVSMVCNLTVGKPKFADAEQLLTATLARATELRADCLALAAADATAFDAVIGAYRLPKETDADKAARTAAIQQALVGAAEVPLRAAAIAAEVITLADRIVDNSNPNVLSDVAVAASSARAALDGAVVNVEVNTGAITDPARADELTERLAAHLPARDLADSVVQRVRGRL